MNLLAIENTIRSIIENFVSGNFRRVYENDYGKRLTEQQIKEGIEDYPGIITSFPDAAFTLMRLYRNSEITAILIFPCGIIMNEAILQWSAILS